MAVQLIKDDNGKTQYVVIPYHEYFRMCSQMAEIDDETDDDLEDIEVEHDSLDDVELPGDVCSIMTGRTSACRPRGVSCAGYPSRRWRRNWASASPPCRSWKRWTPVRKSAPAKAGGDLRL